MSRKQNLRKGRQPQHAAFWSGFAKWVYQKGCQYYQRRACILFAGSSKASTHQKTAVGTVHQKRQMMKNKMIAPRAAKGPYCMSQ
jgi:hypothetical protein